MFKFLKDERGFTNLIVGVVGLVIAIILYTTVVLPIVIGTNKTYNCIGIDGITVNGTCRWDAATIAMYGIIPIALVGGLIAMIVGSKM